MIGGTAGFLTPLLLDALTGVLAGILLVVVLTVATRLRGEKGDGGIKF